jgi:DNA invertase Pin-like site-specific DNA recombinase
LAERARQQGWSDVVVVDDDLGRSGSGVSRPGFERLLRVIYEGQVGAVFAIEASRLARNGRDWHTLIEFCGLVGTILVDEDGASPRRAFCFKASSERCRRIDNSNSLSCPSFLATGGR